MKLAKVLPAMAAFVVLSACANEAPKMENKVEQVATPTDRKIGRASCRERV